MVQSRFTERALDKFVHDNTVVNIVCWNNVLRVRMLDIKEFWVSHEKKYKVIPIPMSPNSCVIWEMFLRGRDKIVLGTRNATPFNVPSDSGWYIRVK